jgi:hypothetical protein
MSGQRSENHVGDIEGESLLVMSLRLVGRPDPQRERDAKQQGACPKGRLLGRERRDLPVSRTSSSSLQ